MRSLFASALLFAFFFSPFSLSAQEIPVSSSSAPEAAKNADQLGSCFDYYRFGSVPVSVTSESLQAAQGASVVLHVTVTNQNAYPVDEVAVYGKVFYKKDFNKSSFGPDVIQLLTLANGISLKAGESKQFTYTWQVPPDIQPGKYQIAAYVASHDRFNLAGLTFTNDIVGSLFNFSIVGSGTGSVRFDNTQTYVNGTNYHAVIFSPQTDFKTEGVPVTAVIGNSTNAAFSGTLQWQLYSWDGINPQNLITQSNQKISLAPGSTTVSYTIKDSDHTVYYLVGQLKNASGEAVSVLPLRYVLSRDKGQDLPRLAFVGATAYPPVAGDTKAFVCIHSTGHRPSGNVKVDLLVRPLDPLSWLLHLGSLGHATYSGEVPGTLSALSVPVSAAVGNFEVQAKLYQDGRLVDSVNSRYSCREFGSSCTSSNIANLLVVLAGIGLILLCASLLRRRRHSKPEQFTTPRV